MSPYTLGASTDPSIVVWWEGFVFKPASCGTRCNSVLPGKSFYASAFEAAIEAATASPRPIDPKETEDSMFLDVSIAEWILNRDSRSKTSRRDARVLVWIYGGAYAA